ncbi:hypothetical protein OG884_18790 [Streptosporangium sp. NBC_01755]|uniref:hypothetical protein n=1 Tax=Streptosporangium sp. NBC_01755 TaxID=2975949 RepID=UPI002DD863D3|nr:hypothetical protein [Streptosporangium sp. NBC_01755]WSD03856.1 hypothetical protein OG884_18790 [Streptosporangium sp. NBC_01755]
MVDRFAWGAGELIPGDDLDDDEADVQEGRHSAPWREDLHPRREDGKFGHGGGSSASTPRHGGGTSSSRNDTPTGGTSGGAKADQPRGMPEKLASSRIPLTGGGTVVIDRHADDSFSIGDGKQSVKLSKSQTCSLLSTLDLADDWNSGDEETIPGVGHVSKDGKDYTLALDGGPTMELSRRDIKKMHAAPDQLDKATRVDSGNGDTDLFAADDKKIGLRVLGDDGRPIEALFTRASFAKIDSAIDSIIDDIDFPDTPGKPVTRKVVATNLGKVRVELYGNWGGSEPRNRLEIEPLDGSWAAVIDGPQQSKWGDAMSRFSEAAAEVASSQLSEHVTLTEAAGGQAPKGRRFRARLIAGDVQGSSGYYPAAMLRQHAGVFRAGLPVYLDHPGVTEAYERPERSVRDLAGRLATPATYQGDGLYADVEVYPHWAPVIEAMADDIGMSIRATGTVEASTQQHIRGPIVTSLTEATSVDFVTTPGAGGRIVALLESARAAGNLAPPFKKKGEDEDEEPEDLEDEDDETSEDDDEDSKKKDGKKLPAFLKAKFAAKESDLAEAATVGTWFESRIHLGFTEMADEMFGGGLLTRAERIGLSSAIGEALAAFNSRVEADHPHLYQRDLWADPAKDADTTITKGAPMSEGTNSEQAPPERGANVTEAARDTALAEALAEAQRASIAFAEAQADAAQRIKVLEEKLAQGDAERLRLANAQTARLRCEEALKTSGLHAASYARVTESVVRDLPTDTTGALDTVKLGEAITAAIKDEATYVAALAEASGAGIPRGLGATSERELSEADVDKALANVFTSIGMHEPAALTAAQGRG